jgi:hypothetical protein
MCTIYLLIRYVGCRDGFHLGALILKSLYAKSGLDLFKPWQVVDAVVVVAVIDAIYV